MLNVISLGVTHAFTALDDILVSHRSPVLAVARTARSGRGPFDQTVTVVGVLAPRAEPELKVFRTEEVSVYARRMQQLDAAAFLHEQRARFARPVTVWVPDTELRTSLTVHTTVFPRLNLAEGHAGRAHQRLDAACAQAMDRELGAVRLVAAERRADEEQQALVSSFDRVVVATDGSLVPGRRGAGIAWVSNEGRSFQAPLPETFSILEAELAAILAAVRAHPHRRLTVLTDSLYALRLIAERAEGIPANGAARGLAARIRAERGPLVKLRYVKAHAGVELNEAADTLAKAARRELHRQWEVAARKDRTLHLSAA